MTQEEHMTSTPTKVDYDIMLPLVCEEHYEYSALLCCPFPGCPNGTSSEEIEAAAPLLEPKVYRRAVWTDEEGEKSYSWEHELPLLFSLPRVMWRESMRKGLVAKYDTSESPIVYHYTTPEGLLGIIDSGELWMSDYSYLNDAVELNYGWPGAITESCVRR